MALCPRCNLPLLRTALPQGMAFQCPKCRGRALGISVLRKMVPQQVVHDLWLRARQDDAAKGADCPMCQQPMAEVPVQAGGGTVTLDVCTACQFVWFDAKKLEQLPAVPREPSLRERLPEEAREKLALAQVKLLEQREQDGDFGGEAPDEEWKWLPALLGLPVEIDAAPAAGWPWLTWALAAAMAGTFALCAGNLPAAVDEFGLVPAQFARLGGITFVTSFFLHGGFWHLLTNAYFLLLFGGHVEDDLGRQRYALLIAVAALAGDLLHILGDPRGMAPCIGASGGISGAIAFYAMRYPRARLGFLFRFGLMVRWISMPAWAAMLVWLLLQGVMVVGQLRGAGNASALAHLGGFVVGLAAWLIWRARNQEE